MAIQYYKIRLSWDGGKWNKTQKGAYTTLDAAIEHCTQDLIDAGYKVFSPEGEVVYPIYYNELAKRMKADGVTEDITYWSDVFDGKSDLNLDYVKTIIERYSDLVNKAPEEDKIEKISKGDKTVYKIPVSKFHIKWHDTYKRRNNEEYSNYANAGYFAGFKDENGTYFTLPVATCVCDVDMSKISDTVKKYLNKFPMKANGKLYYSTEYNSYSQFKGKKTSALCIKDGKAFIQKVGVASDIADMDYALSGVAILIDGFQQTYNNAIDEGWFGSELRNTSHSLIGLKKDDPDHIYYFSFKTTVYGNNGMKEIVNNMKDFGFSDIIKFDGGGSAYAQFNNNPIMNEPENRWISTIFVFD